MAGIAPDDALILPYRANPRRMEFSGTTGVGLSPEMMKSRERRLSSRPNATCTMGYARHCRPAGVEGHITRKRIASEPGDIPRLTSDENGLVRIGKAKRSFSDSSVTARQMDRVFGSDKGYRYRAAANVTMRTGVGLKLFAGLRICGQLEIMARQSISAARST